MTIALMGAAQTGTEDTSAFNARVTALEQRVGDETLTTTAQDCTGAINELDENIGEAETLLGDDALTTTAQTVTGAINELDSGVGTLQEQNGNSVLTTTAQTLSGAINELDNDMAHCAIRSYHTNEALEVSTGQVTWEISTPRWQYCVVSVYETATGVEITPLSITHTTNKIVLEIEADADVAAETYTATIVG